MPSQSPSPPSQDRRQLVRSSLVVMAAFVLAKLVGLLRERAIAHTFGASPELDAYVAAFRIPDLLFTVFAGGALISAFLPVFAGLLAQEREDDAWTVASGITNLACATTLLLAGLAALAAPWLIAHVVAPGFTPEQQAQTAGLMRMILVSTLIFSVSGIQMGILNAFQHFLTPALAPVAYNLGILGGALFLGPRLGIEGLAYGVIVGALLHLVIKLPALLRFGFRWRPGFALGLAEVRQVLLLMGPRVLAMGTVQAVFIVTARLASGLPGGSLSTLNYAWVISQMPQTILGTAVATVAFPTLADQAARGRLDALRQTAAGALATLTALSVPAAVALWVLAAPVTALLLQTGAFDQAAADATTLALRMFALGLLGHVALEIVARMYYAQKDTLTPLWLAVLAMLLNIGLAYLLVGPLAQGGLALANSVAVSIEVLVGLALLRGRLGGIEGRRLASTLGRSLVAALAMGLAMRLLLGLLEPRLAALGLGASLEGLLLAGLAGLVGLAVFLATARLLGLEELKLLERALRRR